jgi:predicted metal-binding membrane protein
VSIAGITALAWAYIAYLAWGMDHMAISMETTMEMTMPQMATWNGVGFGLTFVMWSVMMAAVCLANDPPLVAGCSW